MIVFLPLQFILSARNKIRSRASALTNPDLSLSFQIILPTRYPSVYGKCQKPGHFQYTWRDTSSQLLCRQYVNKKRKTRTDIFSFAFGSMLKVLDSYFIKQREIAMDGNLSSNGERIRLCYDASLIHFLYIGILVLFHANIRKRKYTVLVFSFQYT